MASRELCNSRGKRWCYDRGTRIPLFVRWPEKIRPGIVRGDLVCLLDVAPTLLALASVKKPGRMAGRVFLGEMQDPPPAYAFSARDRMDEAYDRIRSTRGDRFRYIRNFHPELPYAQYINYMDEMPIMRDWRRLAFEGKLNDVQRAFFARTKPPEELYDLATDPFETRNLADSPEHRSTLADMRTAVDRWILETGDLGAIPEKELILRGLVKDLLATEYEARTRLHPATPPVP